MAAVLIARFSTTCQHIITYRHTKAADFELRASLNGSLKVLQSGDESVLARRKATDGDRLPPLLFLSARVT
jgi:hypothetical protein